MNRVLGIHHVTAIASDPQRNLDFYAGVLGLRLVKRTVNFDDPHTYHFYFGDHAGSPGSLLTFFPWPGARRGRVGTGQVAVTSFAVVPGAIGFWVERLLRHGVAFEGPTSRRFGTEAPEPALAFQDPDGLMLEIVGSPEAAQRQGWYRAPGISAEEALRGIHGVTMWVARHEDGEPLLTRTLGLGEASEDETTRRYRFSGDGAVGRVESRAVGGFPRGVEGAGTVHHVAWRVQDGTTQVALRESVIASGRHATPVIDRQYFRSVYFREPSGVLYELATDGPGFMIDEPVEHLGEQLKLPSQYETARNAIEAALPTIHLPGAAVSGVEPNSLGFQHRYQPPLDPRSFEGRVTLLLLHGTGGDENDLLPLGRMLLPGAALLSPRGRVLEGGMPRFFRRLTEGVFDQEDLAQRTAELAAFIDAAASAYRRDPEQIVAVGFSNGANIAASVLLRFPGRLASAVLLSPMLPFEPQAPPKLDGTRVFIGAGKSDPIAPPEQAHRLAELLRECGADVKLRWDESGHTITPGLISAVGEWLTAVRTSN